jgi:hypothetical protein
VDRQRQLAEPLGGFILRRPRLNPLLHPPEPHAHGGRFIGITQFTEQPSDLFRPLKRGANDTPGGTNLKPTGLHTLQQKAFKVAAVLRPIRINPASAALEHRARLLECAILDFRFSIWQQLQPQSRKTGSIIPGLQLAGGKYDAVAAQAALKAQRVGIAMIHRTRPA